MKKIRMRIILFSAALCLCVSMLFGCSQGRREEKKEHEPLTILTVGMDYSKFEALLEDTYPEVRLEFTSYTGSNGTGYAQYLLDNGSIPDIFTISVFGTPELQKKNLLDLSGYEFLDNYKTADINQVALDGEVYLVPASSAIIGLYYNKTLFAENGWEVPGNFDELTALTDKIKEAGMDPAAAQFELPGNGFFDLFTMAKTGFLSTPEGMQWEQDFKTGEAGAKEGLADAASELQRLIDCGFLDAEDTLQNSADCLSKFYDRKAAMYLNAGNIPRFTQNEDGTGDQYGIMAFPGQGDEDSVLITKPMSYYGLSRSLSDNGNEQKLEDALKVMELLATEEGQESLARQVDTYVAPLKNTVIPADSPFHEVSDAIQSGRISTLAYAGYEPIIIGVGEKVRDWVAGKCTGDDVLSLADELQTASLSGNLTPVTVASRDFTLEETAQLQAEAFRLAAGTNIGLVSLGGYHDGVENYSGVCGALFKGDVTQDIVNAVVPSIFSDPLCILTLSGGEIKSLLETGFVADPKAEGFTYIPSGITVSKTDQGEVEKITLPDGTALDENADYTVAVDKGGFTEETGKSGDVKETALIVVDVVGDYLNANSPVSPLEHSIK